MKPATPTKTELYALLRSRDHQLEDVCRKNRSLERDNKLLREISLGMPGVKALRSAMRWYRQWWPELSEFSHGTKAEQWLARDCAALAKHRKKR